MIFQPIDNFNPSIFKRRKNFHGIQLIGMTGREIPQVDYPDDFHLIAPYFPNNQTYDMTNLGTDHVQEKELQLKVNCRIKFGLAQPTVVGRPAQIFSYNSLSVNNSLSASIHLYDVLEVFPLSALTIDAFWSPKGTFTNYVNVFFDNFDPSLPFVNHFTL